MIFLHPVHGKNIYCRNNEKFNDRDSSYEIEMD